ncbi:sulfur carrier protein ThiS [Shewanella marisflavi]|uniref:sulfur carrier protein ThiS n=1 Tax=Shewanella marisflavi TaxID=260364 RepID=UPI003AAC065F
MSEIRISVNGLPVTLPTGTSLLAMLTAQSINLDSVALVRGGELVPKSRWAVTECEADDVVEIFGVVAGG